MMVGLIGQLLIDRIEVEIVHTAKSKSATIFAFSGKNMLASNNRLVAPDVKITTGWYILISPRKYASMNMNS